MKRTASAVALAATVLLAPVTVAGTASAEVHYPNCAAAHAAGASNIHKGQPGYSAALDEDHDGVACESGHPAGGHVSVSTSTTEIQGGPSVTTGSSTTVSGSTTTSGSSASSPAQVAVVPQGGAETGDGSTDGSPWWVAGSLLAGLACLVGLVTARRARSAACR